ncbi:MAG: glycosyltransferase family 2 protein [Coprococcus sp.]|nr:glycosyltransferase family 2 protein [Coprococcus sp.]
MKEILYIVIPCFNEQEVLIETTRRLTDKLDAMIKQEKISEKSRILYVDDGSGDETWQTICNLNNEKKYVTGIKLSRNKGHQNALLAGLFEAAEYADMIVSMDADLQDDIEVLDKFVDEYYKGSQIVYGVRKSRKKDSIFKRTTALAFYKLMRAMGVEIVYNHADYRLMSKRAVEELMNFKEVNLFLRGIVPMIGFKTSTVEYDRGERYAGESKYSLGKMIYFAIDGITSTSVRPIRMITMFGLFSVLFSVVYAIYVIWGHFHGGTVQGWTTSVLLICFFGGAQIMCTGIVGEYVGKIYLETKGRPRFIVEERLDKE